MSEFQALLKKLYLHKDLNRGIKGTYIWLIEEIGELATLLNAEEFLDNFYRKYLKYRYRRSYR
ncbi:MAG: hypothetical protein ACTSPS_08765 [Promethearchaeota archaeon]